MLKKYKIDEVNKLGEKLRRELELAEEDYIKKKKAKGETVDDDKMRKAINQRKKLRILCNRLLGAHLGLGNILNKPSITKASESLERKAKLLEGVKVFPERNRCVFCFEPLLKQIEFTGKTRGYCCDCFKKLSTEELDKLYGVTSCDSSHD